MLPRGGGGTEGPLVIDRQSLGGTAKLGGGRGTIRPGASSGSGKGGTAGPGDLWSAGAHRGRRAGRRALSGPDPISSAPAPTPPHTEH